MLGAQALLALAEESFVELLAPAQSGVADHEVAFMEVELRRVVVDQVDDAHRLSHVEHEGLAELRHAGGFDDQPHGLFDSHEESRHVGMCDGHGFAFFDLLRQHRQE